MGANATANNGVALYSAMLMNCQANAACVEGGIVAWITTGLISTVLLGQAVGPTTSADSGLVAGIAVNDAAAGENVLVLCVGVYDCIVTTGNVAAAGAAIATDTVGSSAGDHANTLTSAELVLAVAGISLEARGSDGRALCYIRCG